ncbi:MAG TPA: NUDIX domain-containing protein [Micromonosporaceae bacterium]|nr:NUDIX domain-containing protein [Micromonosporaceae bacterium]
MTLYHNAVAVLRGWTAPDPRADSDRRRILEFLAGAPGGMLRQHAGGHVTASTVIVDAAAERVLLCLHGKIRKWVQLGGHCEEPDTDLAAAARREATEESGIGGLLLSAHPIGVDIHRVRCGGGALHYDVRYAALAPAGAVAAVSAESAALGWFAPDALPTPLADATEGVVGPALNWARSLRCGAGDPAAGVRPPSA